jgi:hypothetical protein
MLRPDLVGPPEFDKPQCSFCRWALVERTELRRRFKCVECGRWSESLISVENEVCYRKTTGPTYRKRFVDPIPDQTTIYDVLSVAATEGPVLDLDPLTADPELPRKAVLGDGESMRLQMGSRLSANTATIGARYL